MSGIAPKSVSIVNDGGTAETFTLSFNFGTIANGGTTANSITMQPSLANPQGFDMVMNFGTATFQQSTVLAATTLDPNALVQQNGTLDVAAKSAWDLPIAPAVPTALLINDQGTISTATPLGNISLLASVSKGGRNIIIDPISNPVAGSTFSVTGTLTNYVGISSIPLTFADNNTTYSSAGTVTLTNGTGTFNISHPSLSAGQVAAVCVLDSNGLMAVSNNFTVTVAPVGPSIVWHMPTNLIAGYTDIVTADIAHGPIVFKINVNGTDGGIVHHFASGQTADPVTATGAIGSFTIFPGYLTAYLHAFQGTDGTGTSLGMSPQVTAVNPFVINTISNQVSGTAFNITGTYANNSLNSIDYSLDGSTWTTVTGISGNTFSIPITETVAGTGKTISIRDTAAINTAMASNAFNVTAPVQVGPVLGQGANALRLNNSTVQKAVTAINFNEGFVATICVKSIPTEDVGLLCIPGLFAISYTHNHQLQVALTYVDGSPEYGGENTPGYQLYDAPEYIRLRVLPAVGNAPTGTMYLEKCSDNMWTENPQATVSPLNNIFSTDFTGNLIIGGSNVGYPPTSAEIAWVTLTANSQAVCTVDFTTATAGSTTVTDQVSGTWAVSSPATIAAA